MKIDDPAVLDIMRRSMVARIATLSRNGRPNINPLYFIYRRGHLWLGTADWTLAARNVRANPQVSVLLEIERQPSDSRLLRITGRASVRTEQEIVRPFIFQSVLKYFLTPGGIRNILAHFRQLRFMFNYETQSARKGRPCVIDVLPEQAEFLSDAPVG
ncbi:MAG: pyridoxamine 5'-phosphate oxidase family protein [Ktedonobacteraceae bacterium]|nr:pyridoxamine 5'-phosphate oxidase family protein [Ktedonobacteraceae bacterium]